MDNHFLRLNIAVKEATTCDQARRAARNLAISMKKSLPMANSKLIRAAMSLMASPRSCKARI